MFGLLFLRYVLFTLFQGKLFFFNINVNVMYLIFMNLYTSYSLVIMTQKYFEQIISGHSTKKACCPFTIYFVQNIFTL